MHVSDEALIRKIQDGDDEALEQLVGRHTRPVYALAYRLSGSRDDASDIVQESFIKMWKNIAKFRNGGNFPAWLMTITRNTALDFLRIKRPLLFSQIENDGRTIDESVASDNEHPEDRLFTEWNNERLNAAVEKLPPHYREVIALRFENGHTFDDISQILEKPLHTVKSQNRRALMMLKKLLEGQE